jgi:hypothetical protein
MSAKHGVDYTIIQWIKAILEGQLAMVTLGGFFRSVEVSTGCTKGGVLSPLLWSLVIDKLIARFNRVEFILKDIWMTSVF